MSLRVFLSLLLLKLHLSAFGAASLAGCVDGSHEPVECCPLCEVGTDAGLACSCGCGDVTPTDEIPEAPDRTPIATRGGVDDVPAAEQAIGFVRTPIIGTAILHWSPERRGVRTGRSVLLTTGHLII